MKPKSLKVVPTDGPDAAASPSDDVDFPVKADDSNPVAPAPTDSEVSFPVQTSPLLQTYQAMSSSDPDQSAKIMKFSDQTGAEPSYVAKNLPAIEKSAAAPPVSFFDRIEADYPGTTKLLSDPKNMAASHDDMPNLAAHEGILDKMDHAWNWWKDNVRGNDEPVDRSLSGYLQHGIEGVKADQDAADAAREANFDAFKTGLQASSMGLLVRQKLADKTISDDAPIGERLMSQVGGLTGDFVPMTIGGIIGGAGGASAGATTGAAIGSVVPGVGTIGGGGIGAIAGGAAGADAGAFALPAAISQALTDSITKGKVKDFGEAWDRAIDVIRAARNAGAIGAVTAGAGGLAGLVLTKTAASPVLKALAPAIANAAGNPLVKTSVPLAAEVAGMTGGAAAEEGRLPTGNEIMDNAILVAGMHAATHAAGHLGGDPHAIQKIQDAHDIAKSDQALGFYTAFGDVAGSSKLKERLPDKHQQFVADLAKDGPASSLYVPVDAFDEYFQSKHMDPSAVSEELGATDAYKEAKATGGAVEIPFDQWTAKLAGTEHYQGLARDIKFDPDDMTSREADAKRAEIKDQMQKAAADLTAQQATEPVAPETAQAVAGDPGSKAFQSTLEMIRDSAGGGTYATKDDQEKSPVFDRTKAMLEGAGVPSADAEHYAKIHDAFFGSFARHLGVDPEEVMEQYPLTVSKADEEGTRSGGLEEGEHETEKAARAEGTEGTEDESERSPAAEGEESGKEAGSDQESAGSETQLDQSALQARKARAESMGFDTSKVWFHGTPNGRLDNFDPHMSPRDIRVAGFFSPDKEFAREYARGETDYRPEDAEPPKPFIHKVFLKTKEAFDYDKSDHVDRVMGELSAADIKKIQKSQPHINDRPMTKRELRQQIGLGNWSFLEDPTVFEAVKKAGFDAMHVHENGVKNIAVFDPNQIRSINADFDPNFAHYDNIYLQSNDDSPRGRIRFGKKKQFSLDLFDKSDRSTFLHESGHYFLEIMGDLADKPDAPEAVKKDYQTLLDWFGVKDKSEIGVKQHEEFARGFEAYLMEGKAPTEALRGAFDKFKGWLVQIYRHMKALNVNLTDDVRGVMDRMLASQDEINAAKNKVRLTDEIPSELPDGKQRQIKTLQDKAREIAESQLLKEQMAELKEEHLKNVGIERERVTTEAKAVVGEQPIFKAAADLEGDPKFHAAKEAAQVADQFLREKLSDEQVSKFEEVAAVHGFTDGEEMARELILARDTKSYDLQVKNLVDAGMEKYADMKDTAVIKAKAMEAIHGERMTELLALEREALAGLVHDKLVNQEVAKRNRVEARIEAETAREQARQMLSEKPIKQAGNPKIYLTAERNAAVKVAKALAAHDYEGAADAKRKQLLSHALASEAMRNATEIDKKVSSLQKYAAHEKGLDKAPLGFVRQADALLSKFGLSDREPEARETLVAAAKEMAQKGETPSDIADLTGMKQDEKGNWAPESLPDFVDRVNDNYYGLTIPDSVLSAEKGSYKDLTLSDLRDLESAVQAIATTGKNSNRFLNAFDKAEINEAAVAFRASVEEKVGTPKAESLQIGSKHETKLQAAMSTLSRIGSGFSRSLDNMLTTCAKLDGGEKTGPALEYIYRPLKEAEDSRLSRNRSSMEAIDAIYAKHYTEKEFAGYKEQRTKFDVLGGRVLSKDEVLAMALNWGNDGNRDRIMRGFHIDESAVREVLNTLDKKDWDFIQDTWDHVDSYWPEIAALELKVRGVEPAKVPRMPVETKFGSYGGGYYPISYDFEKSSEAYKNAEQKNALYKQYSAASAQTDSGHTQTRVSKVSRPVRLSLDVLSTHIENVNHDLAYRPAVIDVNRFLENRDTKAAITNALGVQGYASIGDWLKSAASDQGETLNAFDKSVRWFRFKTTFFNLSWKALSAPRILLDNITNISSELGASNAATALKNYWFDGGQSHSLIMEKSEFMRQRATHLDRDMADINKKYAGEGQSWVQRMAFSVHAYADQAVSHPLWLDAYNRELGKSGDEKLAVNMADESVKRTFMTGSTIDQPSIMQGSQFQKLVTTAFGYPAMMWNRFSRDLSQSQLEYVRGNPGTALAIGARSFVYTFMMPAVVSALTREMLRNNQEDDQDEKEKRAVAAVLEEGTPLKFIPIARDLVPFAIKQAQGHGAHFQATPLEGAAETLLEPASEMFHAAFSDQGLSEKFPEHLANSVSLVAGIPKAANDLAFNFMDWQSTNGELTWRDFLSRRTKK